MTVTWSRTSGTLDGNPAVEIGQTQFEFEILLALVRREAPSRILEIGTWHGGTLWHWLRVADEAVVSVDDGMIFADDWRAWARKVPADLHLIQGNSRDPEVIGRARELGPYDFLFIDADHEYEAVHADWVNYSPMLAPGGMVAFHDFQERSGPYGVNLLWDLLKTQPDSRTVEIVQRSDPPGFQGIGVLWP